jgi:O-succinylbenzoate synthase
MNGQIEFRRFRRDFRKPLRTASGTWGYRDSIVIRIEDANGNLGFGEVAPTIGFRGESLAAAERFLVQWRPEMDIPADLPLCGSAISCAKSELWRTKPARSQVETAALLVSLNEENLPSHEVLKAKIGVGEPTEEISAVRNLLDRMSAGSRLRLDANGSLSAAQAEIWLEVLGRHPEVEYLEQPLPVSERETLVSLAAASPMPLALDESVVDVTEAESWREAGWPGYFVLKPSLCGDWTRLERFLRKESSRCVVSSVFESPFGFEAVLRMAAFAQTVAGLGASSFFPDDDFVSSGTVLHPGVVTIERLEALWRIL